MDDDLDLEADPSTHDEAAAAAAPIETVDEDVDEFLKEEENLPPAAPKSEQEDVLKEDGGADKDEESAKEEGAASKADDPANGEESAKEEGEKMPWSLYKKSISQSKKGLVTGFDVYSEEEEKKREKRRARWGDALPSSTDAELAAEAEKKSARLARFTGESVPAEWILFESTSLRPLKLRKEDLPPSEEGEVAPSERLYLQALDAEAFKRIRSPDIESFFASHKPTYVEWLGDTTCNVWFEEMHTARRALEAFSVKVPESNWRLISTPMMKAYTDKWGAKGTHATRLVCRFATDTDVLLERPKYHNTNNKKKKRKKQYLTIDSTTPIVVGGATSANAVEETTTPKDPLDAPLKSRRKTSHTTTDF